MAEPSKINHDHTYDILTALLNISPSTQENDELLMNTTSPQSQSDASSDSGLALSPIDFDNFDLDFENMETSDIFKNIGDINDIDFSFLDGLDPKVLGGLPKLLDTDNNLGCEQDLDCLMQLMDDGIVPDMVTEESSPPPPQQKEIPAMVLTKPEQQINNIKITPVVIQEIKPLKSVQIFSKKQEKEKLEISEEERKLLEEEGHVLPSNVALTKDEEKLLKKVRRKIKNKVSAQESRRKKKEYIDGLEFRVKTCTDQNQKLHNKVKSLEEQNKSLLEQLKALQDLVASSNKTKKQTGTCILVLFLAFALVAFPFNNTMSIKEKTVADSYATLPVRSRTLLQYTAEEHEPTSTLNISHYLRAFSIAFSLTTETADTDNYPTSISIDESSLSNNLDENFTPEYSFSK